MNWRLHPVTLLPSPDGAKVRASRLAVGLRVREAARRLGFPVGMFSTLEDGWLAFDDDGELDRALTLLRGEDR